MCPTRLDPAEDRAWLAEMQPPEAYTETEPEDGPPDGGPVVDRPRIGAGLVLDAIEGPLACGRGRSR